MNGKMEITNCCLANPEPTETITCPLCGRNYQEWNRYIDHVDHHRSMGKNRRDNDTGLAITTSSFG